MIKLRILRGIVYSGLFYGGGYLNTITYTFIKDKEREREREILTSHHCHEIRYHDWFNMSYVTIPLNREAAAVTIIH